MDKLHFSATTARIVRWGTVLALLGVIAVLRWITGPGYQPPPASPMLIAAQERWHGQQISDYLLRVRMTYPDRPSLDGDLVISIRNGRLESRECLSHTSSCHLFQWAEDGVGRLFELASEGLDDEAGLVEGCPQVTFDPQYGYPRHIDNARCAAAGWGIDSGVVEVLGFTVIDPAQSPAVQKEPVPADIATRWLRGQPCRLPCYEGLTPGITTAQEAFRSLRQHPFVGSVTLTRFPSEGYGEVAWTWADENDGGRALFRLDDTERIESIQPRSDPGVTLGGVIAVYGEPTDVITTDFCVSWSKERSFHLEFLNRSVGLYLHGPYKDLQHINAELPIDSIIIYDPRTQWTDFDYSYSHTEAIAVSPWRGYQDFYFYSGTNADQVCP
jgi:hypothetical protein